MLALLGLVAVAGYQHRDKISEMLSGAGGTPAPPGRDIRPSGEARSRAPAKQIGTGGLLAS
jgi:hypothetical protein